MALFPKPLRRHYKQVKKQIQKDFGIGPINAKVKITKGASFEGYGSEKVGIAEMETRNPNKKPKFKLHILQNEPLAPFLKKYSYAEVKGSISHEVAHAAHSQKIIEENRKYGKESTKQNRSTAVVREILEYSYGLESNR